MKGGKANKFYRCKPLLKRKKSGIYFVRFNKIANMVEKYAGVFSLAHSSIMKPWRVKMPEENLQNELYIFPRPSLYQLIVPTFTLIHFVLTLHSYLWGIIWLGNSLKNNILLFYHDTFQVLIILLQIKVSVLKITNASNNYDPYKLGHSLRTTATSKFIILTLLRYWNRKITVEWNLIRL